MAVGISTVEEIDKLNIFKCWFFSNEKSIKWIEKHKKWERNTFVLVDGKFKDKKSI